MSHLTFEDFKSEKQFKSFFCAMGHNESGAFHYNSGLSTIFYRAFIATRDALMYDDEIAVRNYLEFFHYKIFF